MKQRRLAWRRSVKVLLQDANGIALQRRQSLDGPVAFATGPFLFVAFAEK